MIIKQSKRLNDVQEYYFSEKLSQIREIETGGKKIINLGIGNPDMMPSENTIEELIRSVKNQKNHGYQSYRGIPELRKAISKFYSEIYSAELNPETEILPLLGSKEGITHISLAFLNTGDKVLVPDPGYPTYSSVSKMCETKIIAYSLKEKNKWLPDLKELEKMNLKKVKLMWLNYPNMPTGAEATDECFEKLIAFAKKHKILLCHDNPYSMVLNNGKPKSILNYKRAKDVAIELNSLSKSFNMAGWRVGWIAGKKEYIDTILKVKSNVDSGMFLPIQKASIEALNNLPSWHSKRNEEYKRRREKVWELLAVIGCGYTIDQVGMFVWAKVAHPLPLPLGGEKKQKQKVRPNGEDLGGALVEKLLHEANVFITPGFIFGENGEGYIRVSLCSEVSVIEQAIQQVKSIFNKVNNHKLQTAI
ncbi:MAG: aminotransferase class I/II-fold pyridoxal phosphate-dependent enzyme [Bacteroidetes bacterium]|nr:aminotransferase class I/II-fold pyridoxal phosphate-dependent enzyme [Bacteroidota bacterium]